jgi:hypothetical protein
MSGQKLQRRSELQVTYESSCFHTICFEGEQGQYSSIPIRVKKNVQQFRPLRHPADGHYVSICVTFCLVPPEGFPGNAAGCLHALTATGSLGAGLRRRERESSPQSRRVYRQTRLAKQTRRRCKGMNFCHRVRALILSIANLDRIMSIELM